MRLGQRGDLDEHVRQRRDVGGGTAPHTAEQGRTSQLSDHLARLVEVDGRNAHGHVAHHLDEDAAEPAHHGRTDERVALDAHDHLRAARDHRLHEDPVDARGRRAPTHLRQHLGEGASHGGGVRAAEPHAPDVGLVRDVGGVDLEHDRIADPLRRADGGLRRCRRHRLGQRYAELAEQPHGFHRAQRARPVDREGGGR